MIEPALKGANRLHRVCAGRMRVEDFRLDPEHATSVKDSRQSITDVGAGYHHNLFTLVALIPPDGNLPPWT